MSRFDVRPSSLNLGEEEVCKVFFSWRGSRPQHVERLSGGFNNANFRVDQQVLRFVTAGYQAARREATLMQRAAALGVPVAGPVEVGPEREGPGLLLMPYIDGSPRGSLEEVGAALARLHSCRFERPGLFTPEGTLVPFEGGADEGLRLLLLFLEGPARRRLGGPMCNRILTLTERFWPQPSPDRFRLVHCDFNLKNLIFNAHGQLAAVLDWEFALVADPLIDLGNFLRFPEDLSSNQRQQFLQGYQAAGGELPEHWERHRRLHDLVSLVAFLGAHEEFPQTFATARSEIARTLEEFDC